MSSIPAHGQSHPSGLHSVITRSSRDLAISDVLYGDSQARSSGACGIACPGARDARPRGRHAPRTRWIRVAIHTSGVRRFTVRNWRHRASLCLALFLGVAGVLSACSSGGASSGGVVQLTFWSFNQQITEQADLFNRSHPNIHVTALKQPSGPNQYYPKVLTAVKAGNAPDVALIEYQYIPTMVSNAALVDISKYGANGVKDQFVDSAWAQVAQGGAVYGYPQDTGPMGFFYNAQTFKKAGIAQPPSTWDEFAQDAVKIH